MSKTKALHRVEEGGTHAAGIGNLRVVLVPDENFWFAQGLEIDYAAQGDSLEDAQENFQDGLSATIHEHLRVYGTIRGMLRVAPQEAWDLVLKAGAKPHPVRQVSFQAVEDVPLPFDNIQFIGPVV